MPRTEILTRSSVELLTTRILPKYDRSDSYDAFITHHVNSKKVPIFQSIESVEATDDESVERERLVSHYEWKETGPDHFFHSATYEMMARMGYNASVSLPDIGLVSINRYNAMRGKESSVNAPNVPLLLPSSVKTARRRTY